MTISLSNVQTLFNAPTSTAQSNGASGAGPLSLNPLLDNRSFAEATVDTLSQQFLNTPSSNLNGFQSESLLSLQNFIDTQVQDSDVGSVQRNLDGLQQLLKTIDSLNNAQNDPVFSLLAPSSGQSFDSVDLLI